MKLTPEMKEIALKVARESVSPSGASINNYVGDQMVIEFVERFLAALPKPEPGVRSLLWGKECSSPHSWVFLQQGVWHWTENKRDWYDGVNVEEVIPLYTAPQDTAAIEQRVAEACAEYVRSGLHDDDPFIIARGLEDGAWRESL